MIGRAVAVIVLLWALGFALFAGTLPRPASAQKTDAIVVPTGGAGRIGRGLALLQAGQARRMLVTGVDRRVRAAELANVQGAPPALVACCVDLGREAVDTRSNGEETARWIAHRKYKIGAPCHDRLAHAPRAFRTRTGDATARSRSYRRSA